MNLSPTLKHYLISFVAGALLTGAAAGVDYLAQNQTLDWRLAAAAVAGGMVMFARDWLRNNSNVVLENAATPPPHG